MRPFGVRVDKAVGVLHLFDGRFAHEACGRCRFGEVKLHLE